MTRSSEVAAGAQSPIEQGSQVNRRNVLLASAVGVSSLAAPVRAMAQATSVKDKLVGAWSLAAIFD